MELKLPEDEIIREMLPEFVESWVRDFTHKYDDLCRNCDEGELYRFGHTLKGSGRQFGMYEIAEFGITIMNHARNQEFEEAAELKKVLLEKLSEVKRFCEDNGLSQHSDDIPTNI